MDIKKFKLLRAVAVFFTSAVVAVGINVNSQHLAIAGVLTGIIFLILVRSKVKTIIDERENTVREKSAQLTYAIFTPTIAIGSFLIILFARDEYYFLQSLGIILAYLSLYLMLIYALSYYFINRKLGGGSNEK